jgi:hypothetical protein
MNILITGTQGLAAAIKNVYDSDHNVVAVSKSQNFDIKDISSWGNKFVDFDIVFNCAYENFAQVNVLEFFFDAWKNNSSKTIVSIGSRIINQTRIDSSKDHCYWAYRQHKLALQSAHDVMLKTAQCRLKIINPGPIDTAMISNAVCKKIDPLVLAVKIKQWVEDVDITRIDL